MRKLIYFIIKGGKTTLDSGRKKDINCSITQFHTNTNISQKSVSLSGSGQIFLFLILNLKMVSVLVVRLVFELLNIKLRRLTALIKGERLLS